MKASLSRRIQKKLTYDNHQYQEYKLPNINQAQFSVKLNQLLDKVSVQNRYATRISHCNMKNLGELEQARKELKKIADQKKMDELKSSDTKQFIEQMSVRVKDSQQELQKVFKQILNAKRQVKHLKSLITGLQSENMNLQKQVLQAKRQRFEETVLVRKQLDGYLLQTQIGSYLVESMNTGSTLYQICLNAHKNNQYSNFFKNLDDKLQKEFRIRERSAISKQSTQNRHYSNYSNIKFKIPKSIFNQSKKVIKRHKTQHSYTITPALLNQSIE